MSIAELAKIGLFSQLVTFLFKERLWQLLFLDRRSLGHYGKSYVIFEVLAETYLSRGDNSPLRNHGSLRGLNSNSFCITE